MAVLAAGTLAATDGAAASLPVQSAEVHDCNHWVNYPNLKLSSVRNMGCRTARGEMRRYGGSIRYRFTTPYRRFRCRRVSGTSLGGQWRCVKGGRAFRFEFGD